MNEGYLPAFAVITEGKVADETVAQGLSFEPGTVVDDRSYNDDGLFARLPAAGVSCVTRMKDKAIYEVVEEHPLTQRRQILIDHTIRLTGPGAGR